MHRLSQTLRVVRPPLLLILLLHVVFPVGAFGWLPRLVTPPLRGIARLLRVPQAGMDQAYALLAMSAARIVMLAEIVHGLSCLALAPVLIRAVHDTVMRLGGSVVQAFCPDSSLPLFSTDTLCGDPYTLSRSCLALLLIYAGIAVDRSASIALSGSNNAEQVTRMPRIGPVLDALTLLLLLSDASPLSIPFAVHVSVDSFLKRLEQGSERASWPLLAQASGNARAFAGASMSAFTLGVATASAQPSCGGQREPAAIVIAARLFSLLADLLDVAQRMRNQVALARAQPADASKHR